MPLSPMADADVICAFRWQLDEYGTRPLADPFLMAVVAVAGVDVRALFAITGAFPTLDDLLAATRADVAAINGVGPKTLAALVAELDRRGLQLAAA